MVKQADDNKPVWFEEDIARVLGDCAEVSVDG